LPIAPDQAPALKAEAEAWLDSGGGWARRLPRAVRGEFDRQTRARRSRIAGLMTLLGAAVVAAFYPVMASAVPDMVASLRLLFIGVTMPFFALVALVVLRDPAPRLREMLLALPPVLAQAMLTYVFIHAPVKSQDEYLAGSILLMLFATVSVQLRTGLAAADVAAILALFAAGLAAVPNGHPHEARNLVAICLVCGLYMVSANMRLEWEQHRAFVLALRERLRRQELTQQNVELDELVRRDSLTGLANRRAYDLWLQTTWRQARTSAAPVGLILIDVDRFKAYNDFYGHPAGDVCLQMVARCVREQLRGTTDLVARIGGEEFAVLLPNLNLSHCGDIAERVRAAVRLLDLPHLGNGQDRAVTISCGVAVLQAEERLAARDLVAATDAALYEAKQRGRNMVCLADPPPQEKGALAEMGSARTAPP
jgi:diguanylate cyclase (GGDEF)-like protein